MIIYSLKMEAIKSFKLKSGFTFKLIKDNLIKQETNIIVNAANEDLWLGGGVAGAIREEGGPEIQKQCDEITKEKNVIKTGEVVYTGIGNFKNKNLKYIFHAVGPVYRDGERGEHEQLYKAFKNCFELADGLKMESIALPPISSGIFGFPKDKCAEIFLNTLVEYLMTKENTGLKEVRMVIIDNATYSVFEKVFNEQIDNIKSILGDKLNCDDKI
jgi:O-acetyl-ADP-ribose deacetylase (regulator of RNase III)